MKVLLVEITEPNGIEPEKELGWVALGEGYWPQGAFRVGERILQAVGGMWMVDDPQPTTDTVDIMLNAEVRAKIVLMTPENLQKAQAEAARKQGRSPIIGARPADPLARLAVNGGPRN